MKKQFFHLWQVAVLATLLLFGPATGCSTLEDQSEQAMKEREDMLLLQEDMRKLSGRIEGLELESQRLRADVDQVRAGQSRTEKSDLMALQTRMDDAEAKLRDLQAAREKDKQELIDKLSARIAQLMGTSSSAVRKQPLKHSGSSTGYEHVVQAGDSLSAIAAAYGVSSKVIMENNDIKDPNKLRVGQKLFIPE